MHGFCVTCAQVKIVAVLPWAVRRAAANGGRVVAEGETQEDERVEPQYRPAVMKAMGQRLREICAKLSCCFAIDTYGARAVHAPYGSNAREPHTRAMSVCLSVYP